MALVADVGDHSLLGVGADAHHMTSSEVVVQSQFPAVTNNA